MTKKGSNKNGKSGKNEGNVEDGKDKNRVKNGNVKDKADNKAGGNHWNGKEAEREPDALWENDTIEAVYTEAKERIFQKSQNVCNKYKVNHHDN